LQRLETSNDPDFSKRLADWLRREVPGFSPPKPTGRCSPI
jgi:hypothetical protein